ncbi:MAG: rhomboid family intramembrane serine protease [Anaerolineales bacterium]|nr:rhomboid family intramembrane serine protease [Anaerolineales bacterium]
MIPIRDGIPTRETPVVNYLLIAANVLVFLWMFLIPDTALETVGNKYAMVPAHFADGVTLADLMTIFTSMFMHAGWAHIAGNMLYLWIFGDNVEDRLGHGRYLVFYLVGGVVASLTHLATNWGSDLPTVGASGAIAAVLGAYLVFFPASRIATFIPLGYFSRLTVVPAVVVLGLWFVLQLFDGVLALGGADVGGVAFWAHVGGFVAGMVMAKLLPTQRRSKAAIAW